MVYSNCQCSSTFCLLLTYCLFYVVQPCGHQLGKTCPLGFPLVLFLFYAVLLYLFVSRLVLNSIVSVPDHCLFIYFEYHCDRLANLDQTLCAASLGRRKGCIRWIEIPVCMATVSSHRLIIGKLLSGG